MGTDPERISGSRYRAVGRLNPVIRVTIRHIYRGFAAAWFDISAVKRRMRSSASFAFPARPGASGPRVTNKIDKDDRAAHADAGECDKAGRHPND